MGRCEDPRLTKRGVQFGMERGYLLGGERESGGNAVTKA